MCGGNRLAGHPAAFGDRPRGVYRVAMRDAVLLAVLLAPMSAFAAESLGTLPLDVTEFVSRRSVCKGLALKLSQPAVLEEQGRWRCDTVEADEQALRVRYKSDAHVQAVLGQRAAPSPMPAPSNPAQPTLDSMTGTKVCAAADGTGAVALKPGEQCEILAQLSLPPAVGALLGQCQMALPFPVFEASGRSYMLATCKGYDVGEASVYELSPTAHRLALPVVSSRGGFTTRETFSGTMAWNAQSMTLTVTSSDDTVSTRSIYRFVSSNTYGLPFDLEAVEARRSVPTSKRSSLWTTIFKARPLPLATKSP